MRMNFRHSKARNRNKQRGFTLIELSLVMIISGLIIAACANAYDIYRRQQAQTDTKANIKTTEDALLEYLGGLGHYPRPAPLKASFGETSSGREVAEGDYGASSTVWRVPGADKDGDGNPDDWVLIGAVPYASLKDPDDDPSTYYSSDPDSGVIYDGGLINTDLTAAKTLDGWGSKLLYAVTESLTKPEKYDDNKGDIDIRDEHDISILGTPGTAHLAVISLGENKRGAYTRNGSQSSNCALNVIPGGPPPAVVLLSEITNCNFDQPEGDGIFLSGLRNDTDNNHNDDITSSMIRIDPRLWAYINETTARNTNPGNVGIGVEDPQAKLDIAGNLAADNLHTQEFCTVIGSDCFEPKYLGGDEESMQCPSGLAARAIGKLASDPDPVRANEPSVNHPGYECVSPAAGGTPPVGTCPSGQFIVSMSSDGTIKCAPPP